MTFFDYTLIAVNLLALVVPSLIFRLISKQDKSRNKYLADELERASDALWKTRDERNHWQDQYKDRVEEREKQKKQIAELEKDRDEWKILARAWECAFIEYKKHKRTRIIELERSRDGWQDTTLIHAENEGYYKTQMRTTWHAHQIVRLSNRSTVCLTAIVQATDGPGAVAAFEAQMKETKAKMRIRAKAPVFAKPVFPNY